MGTMTNKSSGTAIKLVRRFKESDIRQTWVMEGPAAGRAMPVRLQSGYYDLAPMVLYYPPRLTASKQHSQYKKVVRELTDWSEYILRSLPRCSTHVIYVDLEIVAWE